MRDPTLPPIQAAAKPPSPRPQLCDVYLVGRWVSVFSTAVEPPHSKSNGHLITFILCQTRNFGPESFERNCSTTRPARGSAIPRCWISPARPFVHLPRSSVCFVDPRRKLSVSRSRTRAESPLRKSRLQLCHSAGPVSQSFKPCRPSPGRLHSRPGRSDRPGPGDAAGALVESGASALGWGCRL